MAIHHTSRLTRPGVLGQRPGVPLHRGQYVLRTRPHSRRAVRAGRLRQFNREALAMLRHELNALEARRAGGNL